ncbi:hypothetical protein L484_024609 [Morus notabilis]|uniref:Uncharacterized protein n=1 Tax=Morus notabilis TaxID=981085 RepID=W9QRM3_9ROSA|nr:hypothetical protein L484_024609 [Morus notabilis]
MDLCSMSYTTHGFMLHVHLLKSLHDSLLINPINAYNQAVIQKHESRETSRSSLLKAELTLHDATAILNKEIAQKFVTPGQDTVGVQE